MQRAVVLVVEDEVSLRTTICASLTLVGFIPLQAGSVNAALKVLGAEHVDAIVLDVRLPDPNGFQQSGLHLLQFIRATPDYTNVPVVILTGLPLSRTEEELVRLNNANVFYKPQPYSVLIDRLNELLDAQQK
jgi:DNA-binding response OmpR family regulator